MIAGWMVHALVVSLFVCAAGAAADRLLRAHRRPVRWVWLAAGALAVALPSLRPLFRSLSETLLPASVGAATNALTLVTLDALEVGEGSGALALLGELDPVLGAGWVALSLLLVGLALRGAVRLRRRRRGWEERRLADTDVLVSRTVGPAVVGLLRPKIVVPRWMLDGDPEMLALAVRHEREHLRAGDTRLVALGAVPLLLAPWNPALWWAFRRLREAIEVDCDRRVLARRPRAVRRYARTLMEVGRRRGARAGLAPALTEPRSFLERRIDTMTSSRPNRPLVRGLALGSAAVLALAGACMAPDGRDDGPTDPTDAETAASAAQAQDLSSEPVFTPYTARPELANRREVQEALEAEYPPALRDAGIGGTVMVWYYIDEGGNVQNTLVRESSGNEALDEAALEVAREFRFTPARNTGEPVPVWIALPITFVPGED